MNSHLLTSLIALAGAATLSAQVPSQINYQGRLTDAQGAPVTGSKNFSLSIFDAETGGNLLYTETIGAVTLDANGVYSFQFGAAGTSNTQVSETIATTDGTAVTFQKVLDNSPVVAGSVSVTDGTYTWSQSAGSSNEDDFGVAYSTSLRRVTVNYFSGAPAAGRTITATYRYGTSGITGALGSGAEHWMAISVDGTPQAARQRVLAVPFAQRAAVADNGVDMSKDYIDIPLETPFLMPVNAFVTVVSGAPWQRDPWSAWLYPSANIKVAKSSENLDMNKNIVNELIKQASTPSDRGLVQLHIAKGMWITVSAPSVGGGQGKAFYTKLSN